jgi:hypothetical protein
MHVPTRCSAVILPLLVGMSMQVCAASERTYRYADMHDQAIQESLIPVYPGRSGVRPFWNVNSRRFINVPAFDFKPVDGAKSYLFTASCPYSKTEYRFESSAPDALLTRIWLDMPVGSVELKCEALDAPGGKVIGLAGIRKFEKGAVFKGPYYKPEMGYKESAELALEGTFKQSYVRCWLETGKPDPKFQLYAYPSKIIGAVISGAAVYAHLEPRPEDSDKVIEIGKKAADYLISYHQASGTPYEHFPPTYQGKQWVKHANENVLMMIYPAEAAEAYLDLYDVVNDRKYLDAAKQVAGTYVKTQLPNGAWYLFVDVKTGQPVVQTYCTPTAVIHFLGRLKTQYGISGYDSAVARAVAYVMSGPMQTYDWRGQFEDAGPASPTYVNLSRQEVCQFATYLLDNARDHCEYLELAEELLRFAEDQFVVWEVAPERFSDEPKPELKNRKQDQAYWITPSVLEQYYFYVPVCRSMGMLLVAYQKAHQITGKQIYLDKAKAIASALTVGQKAFAEKIDGQFPTLFSKSGTPAKWINNTVYPSIYLLGFSQYLDKVEAQSAAANSEPKLAAEPAAKPKEEPNLPKVLIIGDSISIGYTKPIFSMLAGKATVRRIPGNGEFTAFGLEHINSWLGSEKWDAIHFNWGIWDMHRLNGQVRTTPEQYEKNLRELVSILKATGAKLIWATTTPVGPVPSGMKNVPVNIEDVPVYNAVAAKVMKENGVAIDDLYAAALPKADDLRGPDNRHFKPEGYEFLASKVVESIQAALTGDK